MKINDLFLKDIGRSIQGVIIVGQDENEVVTQELEEYVVTKELNRHFDKFFENYRKGVQSRTEKVGVWISGFFGSGKSHFLKILSYLLSSDTYNGKKAITYFDNKITDPRIMADMQTATDVSTDVILFNIDANADADSKYNKDAIVKVFMKVFNKAQGFCGSMPWIADLERKMVSDGVYETFCDRFFDLSGAPWSEAREDYYFEEDNIVQALADTTKMSIEAARNWYNKAENNYTIDIATFAQKVREYIESKSIETGKPHCVVFLCDEIGQYIGTDSELMLSTQSVVERLGIECGGRAWVIATGQQDIDSIATNVHRDNFSKIIGRFDTRLSLSSSNVDEVIKKRLLTKTETATEMLQLLYGTKESTIRDLISFAPGTPEKQIYGSQQDFVDVYPFIPYQFKLLQAVFNGIRTHGASGKHLSQGERSLLNAFQEAAKQFRDAKEGTLIPFQAFYGTVKTFLDHNIINVIAAAESSAERTDGFLEPYDVEVFKVLFMVKYLSGELPANLENISTLMIEHIDQGKLETKKKVDASLRRLEQQKLITKNGDLFTFLTNEEQDINREIREIKIESSELKDKVGDEIFSVLFGLNKKYRYSDRYDFGCNTMIDERPRGTQRDEIGIRVLTPMYAHGGASEMEVKSLSSRERNVILLLPDDMSFFEEMEQAMQIDTYLRRTAGKVSSETVEDIKTNKNREIKQRQGRCRTLMIEALKRADFYVNGLRLDIKEKQPADRMNDALKVLVEGIYTKLGYITVPFYGVDSLQKALVRDTNQIVLHETGVQPDNYLAIQEMAERIRSSTTKNLSLTLRSMMELFGKIPYGWQDLDIAGVLLTLLKDQEVRLELAGETVSLQDTNLISYVTKREYLERVTIKARIKIPSHLILAGKNIAKNVFGRSDCPNDEDGLMKTLQKWASQELSRHDLQHPGLLQLLETYLQARYPGKDVLEHGKALFLEFEKYRNVESFFPYIKDREIELWDYAEDVQDVQHFFKNQRDIFDKSLKMLKIYEKNRSYVLDPETQKIVAELERITQLTSPYAEIHKLPELNQKFRERFSMILDAECTPIRKDIEADRLAVRQDLKNRSFASQYESEVEQYFTGLLARLEAANNIYEVIAMRTESDRMKIGFFQKFDQKAQSLLAETGETSIAPTPRIKQVSYKTLMAGKNQITSKADIDQLLAQLRTALEQELEQNIMIRIL